MLYFYIHIGKQLTDLICEKYVLLLELKYRIKFNSTFLAFNCLIEFSIYFCQIMQ